MIYTLTTNPSLDYYINLTNDIVFGGKNRSSIETFEAGGKGVNVSIFLDELGMASTTLGFLGGFTKDIYLDYINRYKNIQPSFTSIKENTRINITNLVDNTSINAKGPNISDDEFNHLSKRLNSIYSNDFLIISGNIQDEIKDKMINLINGFDLNDIRLVIDSETDILDQIKLDNCLLVKINKTFNSFDEIKNEAIKLLSKNIKNVLYEDRQSKEVYLFGKDFAYKYIENDKEGNVHYTDSFISGLVYSFARGANSKEAFSFACAACKVLTFSGFNKDIVNIIDSKIKELEKDILDV